MAKEEIPVQEMTEATEAARRAYLRSVATLEHNVNGIIGSLGRSAALLSRDIKRTGDIPVLRQIENTMIHSKNHTLQIVGEVMKVTGALFDAFLSLQDSFNRLRKQSVLTAAAFGMVGGEIDDYTGALLAVEGNLRQDLHITLDKWNRYLESYRKFAVSANDMNTMVASKGTEYGQTVTEGLFQLSSRFDIDIVKVTESFYSTLSRGGSIGKVVSKGATDMLNAWRAVAYSASDAGGSGVMAFNIISNITVGTEAEVSSGSKRILGMGELYHSLFKMLKKKHQQGLIGDYLRAIESGLRNMSISSASLFSGALFGDIAAGQSKNALVAAFDFKAKIRDLVDINDPKKRRVSYQNILKHSLQQVLHATHTNRIITDVDVLAKKFGKFNKEQLDQYFISQQSIIKELLPGLSRGARWRATAVLKKIQEGRKVSTKEMEDIVNALGKNEKETAREIENSKVNYLEQISDMVIGWSQKYLFGGSAVDNERRKQHVEDAFLIEYGTEEEYIERNWENASGETKADKKEQARADYKRQHQVFLEKNYIYNYTNDMLMKNNALTKKALKAMADRILKDIKEKYKKSPKKYSKYSILFDPKVSDEEKAKAFYKFARPIIENQIEKANEHDKKRLQSYFSKKVPEKEELQTAPFIGYTHYQPGADWLSFDAFGLGLMNPYNQNGSAKSSAKDNTKSPPKDNTESPPAYNGVLNATEGEKRTLHHGEMIVPKNQADMVRKAGGIPSALLSGYTQPGLVGMSPELTSAFKYAIYKNESASSGGYGAFNKDEGSSATGKYQFTRRTARSLWNSNQKAFEDLGVSKEDFTNRERYRRLMLDPKKRVLLQERLMDLAIKDYARSLRANGKPVTPETLALVHFLGAREAIRRLKEHGLKAIENDYRNPTEKLGVLNASTAYYLGGIKRHMEEYRPGSGMFDMDSSTNYYTSSLLGKDTKGGETTIGDSVSKALNTAATVLESASKTSVIERMALSGLSALSSMAASYVESRDNLSPNSYVERKKHRVSVPLISEDGSTFYATCNISFDTTTTTEVT